MFHSSSHATYGSFGYSCSAGNFIMKVRELNCGLQKIVNTELNEDSTRVEEDLLHFANWVKLQPHLSVRSDDQHLISFLRWSKWSIEKAKKRIDNFYTFRTLWPDVYGDMDPFRPEIQKVLKAGICHPLPNTANSAGPRIVYLNMSNAHPEETPLLVSLKVLFMTVDILLMEDDNFTVSGLQLLGEYQNTPLRYFTQFNPYMMKKCVTSLNCAYPIRLKNYFVVNVPPVFEVFVNTVIKPLCTEKLRNRIYIYQPSNIDKLSDQIDKSLLPNELGGDNGSLPELAAKWKEKVESYRSWFLEDNKYRCDEKLRVGVNAYANEFGIDGTFRQLRID